MLVNVHAASKRQRGRVNDILDDAFFDPLPDAERDAWEKR